MCSSLKSPIYKPSSPDASEDVKENEIIFIELGDEGRVKVMQICKKLFLAVMCKYMFISSFGQNIRLNIDAGSLFSSFFHDKLSLG